MGRCRRRVAAGLAALALAMWRADVSQVYADPYCVPQFNPISPDVFDAASAGSALDAKCVPYFQYRSIDGSTGQRQTKVCSCSQTSGHCVETCRIVAKTCDDFLPQLPDLQTHAYDLVTSDGCTESCVPIERLVEADAFRCQLLPVEPSPGFAFADGCSELHLGDDTRVRCGGRASLQRLFPPDPRPREFGAQDGSGLTPSELGRLSRCVPEQSVQSFTCGWSR